MDGAVGVILARGKNREGQRQCAYMGSSIWSWSRAAVRAMGAREGVSGYSPQGVGGAQSFPSSVAIYR